MAENELFHEIKCDGITSYMDLLSCEQFESNEHLIFFKSAWIKAMNYDYEQSHQYNHHMHQKMKQELRTAAQKVAKKTEKMFWWLHEIWDQTATMVDTNSTK